MFKILQSFKIYFIRIAILIFCLLAFTEQKVLSQEIEIKLRYEFIPSIILENGSTESRLEVSVPENVKAIALVSSTRSFSIMGEDSYGPFELNDDGINGDTTPDDKIFTLGEIKRNRPISDEAWALTGIPEIRILDVGLLEFTYYDGATEVIPISLTLGVLSSAVPLFPEIKVVNENAQYISNLVNLRDDADTVQKVLRRIGDIESETMELSKGFYNSFPDEYDFLVFISIAQIARKDDIRTAVAGNSRVIRKDASGIGIEEMFDESRSYGSDGKLLNISFLGMTESRLVSNIINHEIFHHWGAYLDKLGITTGDGHWEFNTSIGGILGGAQWAARDDESFIATGFGASDAKSFSNLELYLMGLISPGEVSPIYIAQDGGQNFFKPGEIITGPFKIITIDDIVSTYGKRLPDVENTQNKFRGVFIVTSQKRLLTIEEMTFFNIIAAQLASETSVSINTPSDVGKNFIPFSQMTNFLSSINTEVFEDKNFRPYVPRNPYPKDKSVEKPTEVALAWEGGDPNKEDSVCYDVYMGRHKKFLFRILKGFDRNSLKIKNLRHAKEYFWKIVAKDNQGEITKGPVWSFSTEN